MAKLLRFPKDDAKLPAPTPGARVGDKCLHSNLITPDQLQIALHEQRRSNKLLGSILVELGFLAEDKLTALLAERTGFPSIDLKTALIDFELMRRLPKAVAQRCRAVPVRLDAATMEVAMADPYDVLAMDEIRRYFPRHIELSPLVASVTDIADVIEHYDHSGVSLDGILRELETGESGHEEHEGWRHPILRLVDTIIFDAVRRGASDIHFEPESSFVRLRYRIDGVMQQTHALHTAHWPELSHRLKIMAGMNIADTRSLQDGRFRMQVGGASIDFRMAVMPTAQGENIVVRVLDHRRALLPLEKLGFDHDALAQIALMLERPEGIVLVTGPTGCGKTTTLYAMLSKISDVDVNIMTLEEPIEYKFDLIRQTSVQEGQGLTFAEGVRGILRQDPDIIFIGEVRDADTAQMALRAAMTGHQVFSTLHCNDALGALPRLVDLGLHPRMMAGNISGIVAMRLARTLCPHCRTMRPATEEEIAVIARFMPAPAAHAAAGFAEAQSPYEEPQNLAPMIGDAAGCDACHGTGYRGRTAVNEVLRITPAFDELIAMDAPRAALAKQARAEGFRRMAEDGIAKMLRGEISLASLRRAVDLTRTE